MEHTIKGCIMKYDEPWYDGTTVVQEGAFKESHGKKVPIYGEYFLSKKVMGYAILCEKEDGLYYEGVLNDGPCTEAFVKAAFKMEEGLGLFANRIKTAPVVKRRRKDRKIVTSGNVAWFFITKTVEDHCCWIESIDGRKPEKPAEKERITTRDLKLLLDELDKNGYSMETEIVSVYARYDRTNESEKRLRIFQIKLSDHGRTASFNVRTGSGVTISVKEECENVRNGLEQMDEDASCETEACKGEEG